MSHSAQQQESRLDLPTKPNIKVIGCSGKRHWIWSATSNNRRVCTVLPQAFWKKSLDSQKNLPDLKKH